MQTVSLVNRKQAMLPPIHVPELGLVEHVVGTNERDGKTGAVGRRKKRLHLPQSITLCARGTEGDRVDGLPLSVASSPEVVAAKARGDIDVKVSTAAEPEKVVDADDAAKLVAATAAQPASADEAATTANKAAKTAGKTPAGEK